jgi:hypothetical protein
MVGKTLILNLHWPTGGKHSMARQSSDWVPPPAISGGLPFTLQLLSSGAGVGIGCGVGVGLLTPINLSESMSA